MMFSAVPNKDFYRLNEDYRFIYKNEWYKINAGFQFDGASIPRPLWSLLGYGPFHPDVIEAAMVHDWCFLTHKLSFKETNALFKRNLKKAGVSWIRRQLMWSAVSTVGYLYWRKRK